jgi:hypothetical protein
MRIDDDVRVEFTSMGTLDFCVPAVAVVKRKIEFVVFTSYIFEHTLNLAGAVLCGGIGGVTRRGQHVRDHVRFALLSNMQVGMWDRPLTYPF